ncbi:alpha/beta fold hydrolase [Amycolatopsis anabasis]|uniref:alpha/beta fold hydrolase n=1 Tax=Amycolatopsis anabasis TaxID=1840409 RepID=UPI00131BA99C|nr:alpha/beta fold hydrolase [Amycolatopsis anabasis]
MGDDMLIGGRIDVSGHRTRYLTAGTDGPPVLVLHAWGLTPHAYAPVLESLAAHGHRVCAPALPGFGGTADLPPEDRTFAGYARWLAEFARATGIPTPCTLIGHSFGGGVAIQAAHAAPGRVARLILINSIGGDAWTPGRGLRERPVWDWAWRLQADLLPIARLTRALPPILCGAVPNLLRNPGALWRVGHLARTADLSAALAGLAGLPVVTVAGDRDDVIPPATLASLRAVLGDPPHFTVPGAW